MARAGRRLSRTEGRGRTMRHLASEEAQRRFLACHEALNRSPKQLAPEGVITHLARREIVGKGGWWNLGSDFRRLTELGRAVRIAL